MMFSKKQQPPANIKNLEKVDTVIGKDTEIKGEVRGMGTIRIDGKIEGEINVQGDIVVGETSKIVADITARNVTAAGEIIGNINADGKLEIIEKGKVRGDIKVASLVINDGAIFDGKSQMAEDGDFNARDLVKRNMNVEEEN